MIKNSKNYIIGTSHFGAYLSVKEVEKILFRASELEIRLIDTSPMYGNKNAEAIIGKIVKKNNLEFQYYSKVGLEGFKKNKFFHVKKTKLNLKNITKSVDETLLRLKNDYLDILQLHAFDHTTPLADTLFAIEKLIKCGKIKNYGVCNYDLTETKKLIRFVEKNNFIKPYSSQVHYNFIERKAEKKILPLLKKKKIKIFANRVFSMGILSGQYNYYNRFPKNSRASKSKRISKYINKQTIEISKILNLFASELGLKTIDLSIKWLEMNNYLEKSIIGINNVSQFDDMFKKINLKNSDFLKLQDRLKVYNKSIMSRPNKFLIL
jgi:aryl-alcohol dehydrogenase-like predicted oxidoreductase